MIENLKIYDKKQIVKEYTVSELDLSFGLIEDIIDVLDFEHLQTASTMELAAVLVKGKDQIRPLLMEMYDVTEEEVRHTHVNNLIAIFKSLFAYISGELGMIAGGSEGN